MLKALSLFDPSPLETRTFQAALNDGEKAVEVLRDWDFIGYLAGSGKWMRGQLPLIYDNVADLIAEGPAPYRPYLKTASLRERKRYDIYLSCQTEALAILNDLGRRFCVVKGSAVANTVYPEPFLRHCHDFDVVVRPEDAFHFAAALRAAGYTDVPGPEAAFGSLRLDHPVGLPVVLHTQPVAGDPRLDASWLMEGALHIDTAAGPMAVPEPARRILHAWLHRLTTDRYERQAWVPDTVLDLRHCSSADIDSLNGQIAQLTNPVEAKAAARYLAAQFDRLPQLAQLDWSSRSLQGPSLAAQRSRFRARARAQNVQSPFLNRLDLVTRAFFAYDWVLPPAAASGNRDIQGAVSLWRQRLARLLKGGKRRLTRLKSR